MEKEPPQPPKVHRAARLAPWRWFGLACLAAVPVAAVAGVFGETQGAALVEEGPIAVEVEWPRRAHVDAPRALEVRVRNRSDAPLSDVTVRIDPAWAESFGQIDFEPEPDVAWTFALPALAPGGEARVVGELRPKRAGAHAGFVDVRAGGATATLPLDTFVWP